MLLKVRLIREPELAGLDVAVEIPAAGDFVDEGDVVAEVESGKVGGGDGLVGVLSRHGGVREEHRSGESVVVCEMDKTLASHAFPVAVAGDAFGGGAAPEKGVLFFVKGRILSGGSIIEDFVDVVPGAGVEDVCIAVRFALGEDGEEVVGIFEGRGGEIETMEVGEVGLVAGAGGEGPIAKKEAVGVGGCAGGAVGARVPDVSLTRWRAWRAGNGAIAIEAVGSASKRVIFKRQERRAGSAYAVYSAEITCSNYFCVPPGQVSVLAEAIRQVFVEHAWVFAAALLLEAFVGYGYPCFIVDIEG